VLAIARPDVEVVLVEPLLRRTTFLELVVEELDLANVEVVRGKAEVLHGRRRFDRVTSRALAPLPRLLDWSMPLVAGRGSLIALKGASVHEEVAEAADLLGRGGASVAGVHVLGTDLAAGPTTVLEVVWADPARVRWPGSGGDHGAVGRGSGGRGGRRAGAGGRRRAGPGGPAGGARRRGD
jgi:16S rRNA (guanine527-N7)-methyltransferase